MFNNHSKPVIDERKSSWTHMELCSPGGLLASIKCCRILWAELNVAGGYEKPRYL